MRLTRFRYCALAALFVTGVPAAGMDVWRFALPDEVVGDGNRAKIQAGAAVVEVTPSYDRELAVVGVVKVAIDSQRLVSWVRQIENLQRGTYIPIAHRFSDPPDLDDVRELTLDDQDLDDLRQCRPGNCGLKLSASEIGHIRQSIAAAGADWKGATQAAFRRLIVKRARAYMTVGLAKAAPYHDHQTPVSPDEEFATISRRTILPAGVAQYLRDYPRGHMNVESFLYWSKETLGDSKPIIAVTHVSLFPLARRRSAGILAAPTLPGEPWSAKPEATAEDIAVTFKQVYASHYLTASLSSMSLVSLTPALPGSPRYLVYMRRSRADVLGGMFGGIVRELIERRLRSEAPAALDGLRRRLETEPVHEVVSSW